MTELLIHAPWKIHSNHSQHTALSFGQNAGKATQMLEKSGGWFWHLVYGTAGVEWSIALQLPCDLIENSRLVIVRIITYNISNSVLVSESRLESRKAGKNTSPPEPGIKHTTEAPQWVLNEAVYCIIPVDPHRHPRSCVGLTHPHSLAHVSRPGGLCGSGEDPTFLLSNTGSGRSCVDQ